MFKVYLGNECFYDDRIDEKYISDMKLTLEENKAGSFEFIVYPQHPYYQSFDRMKSIISVTQNDKVIFRGRVLNSEESFYKERKFTCEGEFAFLNDSVIHPDGYEDDEGTTSATPIDIFTKIISDHNYQVTEERQFIIGTISIDGSDKEVSYAYMEWEKSLDAMENLLEVYGGHVSFRHEDEGTYIDWIDSYELLDQTAELGKNIIDLTQTVEGGEIITGILPTGDNNENTGYPTNISEMYIVETEHHKQAFPITSSTVDLKNSFPINGKLNMGNIFGDYGLVIVNKPLFEKYGAIIEQRSYDGYPADWIQLVLDEVDALTGLSNSIEITVVDLGWLEDVSFLEMEKKIKVVSEPHGVDDTYSILKLELDLQKPESNKITLNKTINNFIDHIANPNGGRPVGNRGNSAIKYSYAYALSDSNTVCPIDSDFSESIEINAEKYLWVRITTLMSDSTSTKSYYCAGKGEGSKFEISASSTVIIRNDRLTTSQTITFTADINGYTKARPKWYINNRYVAEGGTYTVTIPYRHAEGFSISLFNGTQLMDTLNIDLLDETADPLYLGAYDSAVPTQGYDDEGNALILSIGDYFLCSKSFDAFKAGNPYRWNGTRWEEVYATGENKNVSPDMYGNIMSSCLDDALLSDTVENTKFMSWFRRLATKEAFIDFLVANEAFLRQLLVYNLSIGSGTETNGFYMRIMDGDPPTIVCKFNGRELWRIDPVNGLMYGNFAEVTQYFPFTFNDSLDALHPAVFDFCLPDGIVEWVKISLKGQSFRNYCTVSKAGGTVFDVGGVTGSSSSGVSLIGSDLTGYRLIDSGHLHTIPSNRYDSSHTHELELGINEGSKPSNITVMTSNDGGISYISSMTVSNETRDVILSGITSSGWKSIKVISTTLGRVQIQILAKMRITTVNN